MKYFRAFRLVGAEAMEEYYRFASEMLVCQKSLTERLRQGIKDGVLGLELKINEINKKMYDKYGMIPHLHYHAAPEKGIVSELISEVSYKSLVSSGKVKEGEARKLEISKDGRRETGYSIPVFKLENPENIQEFDKLLKKWQDFKFQLKEAVGSRRKQSLTEQYEAFTAELKNNYKLNSESQYVFEATEIGVYVGISEEHLNQVAEWQKQIRQELSSDESGSFN